jgi:carboxypeptidase C (cathepsin A)
MTRMLRVPMLLVLLALLSASAASQEKASSPDAKPAGKQEPKETLSKTKQSITIGGAKLEYEAVAGTLVLKTDDGKAEASIFFVSYRKLTEEKLNRRPITFAFNGGPGSSSVWLHLGALGPKRIVVDKDAAPVAPYRFIDNEYSLLDATDLVFIDPVTTGYSRAAPGQDPKKLHGVQEDIRIVGDFIRLYTTRFGRWESPKFLAGESYGTTRAAGLSRYLQNKAGINLNGIILISSVLNFETIAAHEGNELPFILFLPTYTATAWYHHKLPTDLQKDRAKTLAEVEEFALKEYAVALLKGNTLPPGQRQQVAAKLAKFTGLTEDYVKQSDLRIRADRFRQELLRPERRNVGRYDSRLQGIDLDALRESPDYDPSYAAVQGPYTAALNQYLHSELKYQSDLPYNILTDKVQPWDYGNAKNRYLNVAPELKQAMTENRGLRVFVGSGYYDLATPYLATNYTFSHLGIDASLTGHVVMKYYDGGHMMYTDTEQLQMLKRDLAEFLEQSMRGP